MNKQILVSPNSGILLRTKKDTDYWYMQKNDESQKYAEQKAYMK